MGGNYIFAFFTQDKSKSKKKPRLSSYPVFYFYLTI